MDNYYVDVDYYNVSKDGERISGDVFLMSRDKESRRIVSALSDGLGSGVKANVLSSLTAHMIQRMSSSTMDLMHSAEIVMNTLPTCKDRNISYSTFTIADVHFSDHDDNYLRLIEYDNPKALLFKGVESAETTRKSLELKRKDAFKKEVIYESNIPLKLNDRVVVFTDGVTQSGMGDKDPLGWGMDPLKAFISKTIKDNPDISSRLLSKTIVLEALSRDGGKAKDDITAFVVHLRRPRCTLLVTGAPFSEDSDKILAKKIKEFDGKRIIAGGTTSKIVSRELSLPLKVDLSTFSKDIPPQSKIVGIDLVTEGMITLNAVADILDEKKSITSLENPTLKKFARLLLDSDKVHFIVGTKINESYQDPNLPMELGIRRTVVNRIRKALEENFLKKTSLEYL